MPKTRSSLLEDRAEAGRRLGIRLAAVRRQAGISQLAAAKALGVPKSMIGKLERGKRQLQFLEALRLAAIYRVDCRDLDPSGAEDDRGA
jgi:transcriptional regulator with XRE-family HTH domain